MANLRPALKSFRPVTKVRDGAFVFVCAQIVLLYAYRIRRHPVELFRLFVPYLHDILLMRTCSRHFFPPGGPYVQNWCLKSKQLFEHLEHMVCIVSVLLLVTVFAYSCGRVATFHCVRP